MPTATVHLACADGTLHAYLKGEIDHDAAQSLRRDIDAALAGAKPQCLILDFGHVTFMDSSGLGLILGRQRRMQAIGGCLRVQHPPEQVAKILALVQIEIEHMEV